MSSNHHDAVLESVKFEFIKTTVLKSCASLPMKSYETSYEYEPKTAPETVEIPRVENVKKLPKHFHTIPTTTTKQQHIPVELEKQVLPISSVPLNSERKRKRPTNTPSQKSRKIGKLENERVQVEIKGRQCVESTTTNGECTCMHSGIYRRFIAQQQKVERPKLQNAPGGRAITVSGSNGVDSDGTYIEQVETRNGKPCFARDSPRGGAVYYCKRTKYWKICQDGHPLRENGWNYSQIAEEDSDMPPLGLWTNEKKIQRETKREYADFRVEMVGMNIKG